MDLGKNLVTEKCAPIVEALSTIPGIEGILCFGSYAMGTFDEYSDVDLYVLSAPAIPAPEVRRKALWTVPTVSDVETVQPDGAWNNQWCPENDRCRVAGLQFELSYNTMAWMLGVVRAVKESGQTSTPEFTFRAYTLLGLLEYAIVLYDPASTLREVKARLYPYPLRLKETIRSENLAVARGSIEELEDYVKRGIGPGAFQFHYFRAIDAIHSMLFAINERYDPAVKRGELLLQSLPIVPERFSERYSRILETPLTIEGRREIAAGLKELLIDIERL
jgi:hypothetical protein